MHTGNDIIDIGSCVEVKKIKLDKIIQNVMVR